MEPLSEDQFSWLTPCGLVEVTDRATPPADTTGRFVLFRRLGDVHLAVPQTGGRMPDSLRLPRLFIPGLLLLLLQTGCSTSSLRNLFTFNRSDEYHTLEELEKQSGRKSEEPPKSRSWNPLKRATAAAAGSSREATVTPAETEQAPRETAASGNGARESHAKDPFLRDEALTATAKTSRPAERSESAEALIAPRSGKAAVEPSTSSLEARKLAELDALLEGRELAGARQVSGESAVTASRADTAAKKRRATAAKRPAEASQVAAKTASTDRPVVRKPVASAAARRDADVEERAEPLILERAESSKIASGDRMQAVESDAFADDAEELDETEPTSVAAAEMLFGGLSKAPVRSAAKASEESGEFSWKASAKSPSAATSAGSGSPLRLAGMQRTVDEDEESPALSEPELTPEFDEQPGAVAPQVSPVRAAGLRRAAAFDDAPEPLQTPLPRQQPTPAAPKAVEPEPEFDGAAASSAEAAEVVRPGLIFGLSTRTWGLAVAGGIVLGLLFLPGRRRNPWRQAVTGHA